MTKIADSLLTFALMLLGSVVMATPLALWVAWTDTILLLVLAAGISAGVLYCVLVRFEKSAGPERRRSAEHGCAGTWTERTVAELQRLHPFIHHHRPSGGPGFRMAMSDLKKRFYWDRDR